MRSFGVGPLCFSNHCFLPFFLFYFDSEESSHFLFQRWPFPPAALVPTPLTASSALFYHLSSPLPLTFSVPSSQLAPSCLCRPSGYSGLDKASLCSAASLNCALCPPPFSSNHTASLLRMWHVLISCWMALSTQCLLALSLSEFCYPLSPLHTCEW